MKRFLLGTLIFILSLFLAAATVLVILGIFITATLPEDPVIASLPEYESKEFYSSGGFQDYTDYGKYAYSLSGEELTDNPYLQPVREEDLPVISGYLDNFENWVEICTEFPSEKYDFDRSLVAPGGYFCIRNHYEEPDRIYWDYDLYYFDPAGGILYFFHNNI